MTISDLLPIFKERFSKFTCQIVDEDLTAQNTSYLRYNSVNKNWVAFPLPNVRGIIVGIETAIPSSAYTVTAVDGYITFSVARGATETIRADYYISPFTDAEITSILNSAFIQIKVLSFHIIDVANFSVNYSEAILKKAFTIALREIQFPTTKYFSLSIAGRSIDKSNQGTQINALIDSNEKELLMDLNALRYFDKTNIIT